MSATTRIAALGACTLLAMAVTAATASAAVPVPLPIGPNTTFSGLVDGDAAAAVIQVGCFGPIVVGETGHPLAGQDLEVIAPPASTADVGDTGSLADAIDAYIDAPVATTTPPAVVFNSFYVLEPIPTTISVPCYGPGTVDFVPVPTSPTARTASVPVTFASQTLPDGS